ncbi:MAG TPA: acyl-CoA dehydrogenase family protein, partial [Phycisphaerae bacterium]|nr:acyl-CoA dehydrogenase family protein [Phycisphaerae bacterium]
CFEKASLCNDPAEAARLLVYKAAWCEDVNHPEAMVAASMAKWFGTDAAMKVTTECVQLFGGYGYCKEYPVERYMRDAKLCEIGEGSSEIQRIVIARQLLEQK